MMQIILDAEYLKDKNKLLEYINQFIDFDEPVHNLDAFYDVLSEVHEDTQFIIDRNTLIQIVNDNKAYTVLCLLSSAALHNPYLHIVFRRDYGKS